MTLLENVMKTGEKDPSTGMHETVDRTVLDINLDSACRKVAEAQNWDQEKTKRVEKKYRDVLSNFTKAFEGHGVVSTSEEDTALLWLAHCEEGEKYASDMLALAKAIASFRGKSLDEKFPGPPD